MEAAASTIPKNPKIPATRAITRNSTDHFNMSIILSFRNMGSAMFIPLPCVVVL